MKPKGVLAAGAAAGFLCWTLSPHLTGTPEPWDARRPGYLIGLFLVGAILGLIEPRGFWRGALGVYLGEAIALTFQAFEAEPSGSSRLVLTAPDWLLFLASYSLPVLVGAACGAALLTWRRPEGDERPRGGRR